MSTAKSTRITKRRAARNRIIAWNRAMADGLLVRFADLGTIRQYLTIAERDAALAAAADIDMPAEIVNPALSLLCSDCGALYHSHCR